MKSLSTICALIVALASGSAAYAADAYIEVDGTFGIDTRYNVKNSTRCEIDYALPEARPSGATWYLFAGNPTFCSFLNDSGVGFGVCGANNNSHWATGKASDIANTPALRLLVVLDIPNNSCFVINDGVTNATASLSRTADYRDDRTLKLASNAQGSNNYAKMRIFGCRIYEADVLVHEFKPLLKDGIAGLIDTQTDEFVTNGKKFYGITIGGDYDSAESTYVATPSGYDNGVYINTGYQASSNTSVMLDCALKDDFSGEKSWWLFSGAGSTFYSGFINPTSGYGTQPSSAGVFDINYLRTKDVRHTFVLDTISCKSCVVTAGETNGVSSVPLSTEHNATGNPIKIAAEHDGSPTCPLKVYGCKIFEKGILVRDFVPAVIGPAQDGSTIIGLQDSITGAFATYPDTTAEKHLSCSGKLAPCPPYVETKRSDKRYIDTGYTVTTATKVEIDYSPAESRVTGDTWYLFGAGGGRDSNCSAFINNGGFGFINTYDSWKLNIGASVGASAVNVRRTVILDNPAGLGSIITEGVTNATCSTTASGTFASNTLKLSAPNTATAHHATIRIYRCRIWEKEDDEYVLKHDFVPAVVNGVAGLQDILPGGAFRASGSASPLTYGGVFDVAVTQSTGKISSAQTATLTASAIGATSYRWLCNGEPIDGGEDGTLTVRWRRPKNAPTDTYQAVAIYAVGDATMESEASEGMTVENEPLGMVISVQ
ncbi:MAG: hypothetical protein IKQ17_07745 [Kiritimatiellae bacterium]|nr:hypothetical protein [Kiritimatiellia bacterium]